MTDKNVIFVDVDDTILEFHLILALVALNEFGIRLDYSLREWCLGLAPIISWKLGTEIFKRCHDREYIFLSKPLPGSVEGCNRLQELGYDIRYLTDRKLESYDDTKERLEVYGFPNSDSLTCSKDKREHLTQHKDKILTVFDDRPRTLYHCRANLGLCDVFSLKYRYNDNLSDIPGIHLRETWPNLMERFEEVYAHDIKREEVCLKNVH